MHTYLGVDIGTSAVKVLLVSGDGSVLDSHSVSYGTDSPNPLWNEQDPAILWNDGRTHKESTDLNRLCPDIGGDVKSDDWLQMLADVLNLVIHKYDGAETGSALGAVRLAILSHTTQSIASVCTAPVIERTFTPNAEKHKIYTKKHAHFTALFTALEPTYG